MTRISFISLLILLYGCVPTFDGRIIKERLSFQQMAQDPKCQHHWDYPTLRATACSWVFPDPLNLGKLVCHIRYVDQYGLNEELQNCATVDIEHFVTKRGE